MTDLQDNEFNDPKASLYSQEKQIMVANKYIIDKKIGKGSFGEVYKGYDKETRCPVAIKVVSRGVNTIFIYWAYV